MRKPKYVIRKTYIFEVYANSCTGSSARPVKMHVKFDHDEAMYLGEYLHEYDPYEMSDDYPNLGMKETLDERLVGRRGWEEICDSYICWPDDLKKDIVDYYKRHMDKNREQESSDSI